MFGGGASSLSITRSSVAPPGFGTGLGKGVMNRLSNPLPNQLGLLGKYQIKINSLSSWQ